MKKEWKRQARDEEGREEAEERPEGEVLLRAEDDEDSRGTFNVGKRVGRERTPADVELRLQEAAARRADTLYLNNHSIRHLDSPLLPQVAECMEKLSLHLNLLTSFPLSLLSFHKLRYLNLSHNSIAGPIPKAIGRLTGLGALILAYNRITSFPTSVAKMTSLHDLYLEGNPTLLYMPAEVMLRARADPGFLLKWNSTKDSKLTEEKRAQLERCEPVAVPTLLNLACCAVLVHRRDNRDQIRQLPQDLQEYLRDTYRCWRCGRKCTGRPAVVVIRRVNLAPRQKQQNRRAAGYWGGEPTATPCLFTFDRLGCYNAWHDADDPGVVKGGRKEAVLNPAATDT